MSRSYFWHGGSLGRRICCTALSGPRCFLWRTRRSLSIFVDRTCLWRLMSRVGRYLVSLGIWSGSSGKFTRKTTPENSINRLVFEVVCQVTFCWGPCMRNNCFFLSWWHFLKVWATGHFWSSIQKLWVFQQGLLQRVVWGLIGLIIDKQWLCFWSCCFRCCFFVLRLFLRYFLVFICQIAFLDWSRRSFIMSMENFWLNWKILLIFKCLLLFLLILFNFSHLLTQKTVARKY